MIFHKITDPRADSVMSPDSKVLTPDSGVQSAEKIQGLIFDPYNFRLNADESIGDDKCD